MPSRTRNRYVTRTRPRVSDAALLPCAAPWLLTSCPWPLYMRVPALVALPMAPEAPPVLCGRPAAARACPCGVSRLLGPLGDLISAFPAPLTPRISDHPPPECSGMILGCLATFSSVWRALGSRSAACDWHSLHLIATCALTGTPRNLLECIPRSVVLLESIPSIGILCGSEVPRICTFNYMSGSASGQSAPVYGLMLAPQCLG